MSGKSENVHEFYEKSCFIVVSISTPCTMLYVPGIVFSLTKLIKLYPLRYPNIPAVFNIGKKAIVGTVNSINSVYVKTIPGTYKILQGLLKMILTTISNSLD